MLALLSLAFLSWLRSSRSNVTVSKRNVMVLILALSMIAYVVNGVTGTLYFSYYAPTTKRSCDVRRCGILSRI